MTNKHKKRILPSLEQVVADANRLRAKHGRWFGPGIHLRCNTPEWQAIVATAGPVRKVQCTDDDNTVVYASDIVDYSHSTAGKCRGSVSVHYEATLKARRKAWLAEKKQLLRLRTLANVQAKRDAANKAPARLRPTPITKTKRKKVKVNDIDIVVVNVTCHVSNMEYDSEPYFPNMIADYHAPSQTAEIIRALMFVDRYTVRMRNGDTHVATFRELRARNCYTYFDCGDLVTYQPKKQPVTIVAVYPDKPGRDPFCKVITENGATREIEWHQLRASDGLLVKPTSFTDGDKLINRNQPDRPLVVVDAKPESICPGATWHTFGSPDLYVEVADRHQTDQEKEWMCTKMHLVQQANGIHPGYESILRGAHVIITYGEYTGRFGVIEQRVPFDDGGHVYCVLVCHPPSHENGSTVIDRDSPRIFLDKDTGFTFCSDETEARGKLRKISREFLLDWCPTLKRDAAKGVLDTLTFMSYAQFVTFRHNAINDMASGIEFPKERQRILCPDSLKCLHASACRFAQFSRKKYGDIEPNWEQFELPVLRGGYSPVKAWGTHNVSR